MNSSSRCQTPSLGSLTWGSEPSLQWVDFCGISVPHSVSHPPTSYGFSFYSDCTPPTVSLWLLLCLWMWGVFFGEFQCLPVDDCPAASCDSCVLARGSESTSFYSAVLVPPPNFFFFKNLFIYLFIYFIAVLCLPFCVRAFSSCGKRGPLFISVRGPLTIATFLVAEHRLQTRRLSSCGSRA